MTIKHKLRIWIEKIHGACVSESASFRPHIRKNICFLTCYRNILSNRQLDVSSSRWHINHKVIQIPPVYLQGEKSLHLWNKQQCWVNWIIFLDFRKGQILHGNNNSCRIIQDMPMNGNWTLLKKITFICAVGGQWRKIYIW